jgi:nitrite reductase (NO-forming)
VVYLPEGGAVQAMPRVAAAATERELPARNCSRAASRSTPPTARPATSSVARGSAGAFPPLAAERLPDGRQGSRDRGRVARTQSGEVTVNGQKFNGVMPSLGLSNTDIAAVLSYVRTNFGNQGDGPRERCDDVKKVRAASAAKH